MTNAMTTRTAFMERVMSRRLIAILALIMALFAMSATPAAAQTGGFCSKFDGAQDGWGPCEDRPNVIVNTTTNGGESPGELFPADHRPCGARRPAAPKPNTPATG